MTFDLLSEYRKRAGLTQKEVGDRIGISSQAVSKWENGQAEPDIDTLYRLAELYNITVDELVGKSSGHAINNKDENSILAAIKDFILKYKKIIIISFAAVVALVAAIVIICAVRDAREEARLYNRYERLELGMTMKEVKGILGKAEETESNYFDDENSISAGMSWALYGYINSDFWYYRGDEYDENVKATNEFDLEYEYLPYYQLRVTFDADGKLIEAYFNTETDFSTWLDDYGGSGEKVVESIEYLDGAHEEGEKKEKVKIFFEDGSAYLGEVKFATNYKGEYIDHPWGDFVINQ